MKKHTKKQPGSKGSGRTAGSFSFVTVTLKDLNAKFADQTQPIVISRKFAQNVGFENLNSFPVQTITGKIEGLTPDTKIAAEVIDFDKE